MDNPLLYRFAAKLRLWKPAVLLDRAGKPIIVCNLQVTDFDAFAKATVYAKCGSSLPYLTEGL